MTNATGRVLDFNTVGATSSVSGLRFANSGFASDPDACVYGGAMRVLNSDLTLTQTVFSGNSAGNCGGGALYFKSSSDGGPLRTLIITDSTFSNNTVPSGDSDGGALYIDSGNVTITRSTFTSNSCSNDGGAVYHSDGTLTVIDSVFTNNTAEYGGAISRFDGGTTTITGSTFSGNAATYISTQDAGGGALFLYNNTTTIENSTFSGNTSAGSQGSAIHLYGGSTILRNVTIAGNSSSAATPAALFVRSSEESDASVTLINTVITNTIGGGADFATEDSSVTHSESNSFISNTAVSLNGSGNTTGNPNAGLGVLSDNGGPAIGATGYTSLKLTMLPNAGSPLVNAGNNTGVSANDERGAGYPRIINGVVDIGAIESSGQLRATEVPVVGVAGLGLMSLLTAALGLIGFGRKRRR